MSKIFFSGIGGSGVSALASFMADHGHSVFGSDRLFDKNPHNKICKTLSAKGITIVPQDGSGIDTSCDIAVFSTAIEDNQPEMMKAKELGITVKARPQYLYEITSKFKTVAVAGTSGKSTTSGMLAFLMDKLGMEPNFIGGGRVKQFKTPSNPGNSLTGDSDIMIIEACESDGSIVLYHPSYSLILNLSLDHNPIAKTREMFETLSENTKEKVFINVDDINLNQCHIEKPIRFSLDTDSDYQGKAVAFQPFGTTFTVHGIPFKLSLPGKYNLYNALSCIAFLSEKGIALKDIAEVLPDFAGIERRFDIYLNDGDHLVIDDYAHNPQKISCLMGAVKNICEKVCYIFQPHGFGPTRLMKTGYIDTFIQNLRKDDHLFLLPIYYAGGTSQKDISSRDLLREIQTAGKSVEFLEERAMLYHHLPEWNAYVVFGARDETLADFAEDIAFKLKGISVTKK